MFVDYCLLVVDCSLLIVDCCLLTLASELHLLLFSASFLNMLKQTDVRHYGQPKRSASNNERRWCGYDSPSVVFAVAVVVDDGADAVGCCLMIVVRWLWLVIW